MKKYIIISIILSSCMFSLAYTATIEQNISNLRASDNSSIFVEIITTIFNSSGNKIQSQYLETSSHWEKATGNEIYFSGNVGIGVSNPSSRLHVNGQMSVLDPINSNNIVTKGYVDSNIPSNCFGTGKRLQYHNNNWVCWTN